MMNKKENQSYKVGDTITVYYKVKEGDKVRIQPFSGLVIAEKGRGVSKTFTVRRVVSGGYGVERIFPVLSPNIEKIEVTEKGYPRRAKLYYLRNRVGKEAVTV